MDYPLRRYNSTYYIPYQEGMSLQVSRYVIQWYVERINKKIIAGDYWDK